MTKLSGHEVIRTGSYVRTVINVPLRFLSASAKGSFRPISTWVWTFSKTNFDSAVLSRDAPAWTKWLIQTLEPEDTTKGKADAIYDFF